MSAANPSEAQQEAAFQILEAQFSDVQREFQGLQATLRSSEARIESLHQGCLEKDSTLDSLREELHDAKDQIRSLEEQLGAEKTEHEALENSIKMERTEKEVAEELAKGQQEAMERSSLEIARLQNDSAQLRGALSRVESSAASLEDDNSRLEQQVRHLTSELASLRHTHLKEKMELEQQIAENSLKWESADAKLQVADQNDQSLREMLKRMEEANADLLNASSSRSDLWAQKETELQNDADRLAEESINLRSEVHKLQSSSTEFQAMFNELAQQVHDTEQAHEKRLRDTREELVAAKKQIRDTAAWGPGIPARLPGLSSLTTKQDDILQEEFAEFSLESVRNLSQTDLLIEFSNLLEAYNKVRLSSKQKSELVEFIEDQQRGSDAQRMDIERRWNVANETCIALRSKVQELSKDSEEYTRIICLLKDQLRSTRILQEVAESSVIDLNQQVCDLLEEVYMIKSSSHFVQYTSTAHRSRPGSQNGTPRSSPALKSIKDFQLQNRELKESLHKLQKQMQFEKEEFAMRLENASTDAKLAVERELTAVKGDFEKTKTELEAVQKQFKEDAVKAANDLSEVQRLLEESNSKAKQLPVKITLVEQLNKDLSIANCTTAMAKAQCSILQTQIRDLHAQLEVLRQDKASTSTMLDLEKRSSASLQVALQGSGSKKVEMETTLEDLKQRVASRDAENAVILSSRESALKKLEEAVCECERVKGEMVLCKHSKKEALEMVGRLECEVLRWRNLASGKQGDLDTSLRSSSEKLQAAALLEADLRASLKEKDDRIAALSTNINELQKAVKEKDESLQKLNSELSTFKKALNSKAAAAVALKQRATKAQSVELDSLKSSHAKELGEVKKAYAVEIASCKAQHARAMETAAAAHTKELEMEKQAKVQAAETLEASYLKEASLLKKKVLDLYKDKKRMEEERKTIDARLQEMEKEKVLSIPKDDPKDNLKNDTNQMLEALNLENGKLKMQCEELQAKVKELEEAASAGEGTVPAHLLEEANTRAAELEKAVSENKGSGNTQLQNDLLAAQKQLRTLESIQADLKIKLKDSSTRWEESQALAQKSSAIIHKKDSEIALLEEKFQSAEAQLDALKGTLDTCRQELAALKSSSTVPPAASNTALAAPQSPKPLKSLDELREAALMSVKKGIRLKHFGAEDAPPGDLAGQELMLKRKTMDESDQGLDAEPGVEIKKIRVEKHSTLPVAPPPGQSEDKPRQELMGKMGNTKGTGNESPTSQNDSLTSKEDQEKPKYTPIVFAPPQSKPTPKTGARGRRGGGRGGR